ncbi:MAG: transcription termination factor Rho, partial [Acidimicrobiia bacterium]|nr:transcription termination factor Rho [Acidimicrobiia bacterium]
MSEKDQRATLEAKDRDELMTIASTLGGKPGSRAKKADVIEMILELIADSEPAAPKPRRGRPPKAAVVEDAPVDEAVFEFEEDEISSEVDDAVAETESATDDDEVVAAEGTSRPQAGSDSDGEFDGEGGARRRRRRGRDRGGERSETRTDEPWSGDPVDVSGVLDLRDEGYGFIRVSGYLPTREDVYVSVKQTRQFSLRRGDVITGTSRPAARNEKNPALLRIDTVNDGTPDAARDRRRFDDLTPLFPDERLTLSSRDEPYNMTSRIIDLLSPIGKGQRGLIVAPPKAGKTTVMKQIAKSISENNPDVHLMVLLVDERPE